MNGLLKPAMAVLLTAFLFSCASSRYQDGFSYRPAYAGPDMGADDNAAVTITQAPTPQPVTTIPVADAPTLQAVQPTAEQVAVMQELVETGLQAQQEGAQDLRATVRQMAGTYAAKNNIQLTEKQMKKLDKVTVKMEKRYKKKMGPNVTWGPSNNLEWAILGAAAVGLFVGIFGIGFGWFIFLVAALAYLYFKLLHNN